jgi:non-ribosomal peptide synthetase component E (peptide arylation enzyme)
VVVDGEPPTLESVNAALTRQGLAQYLRPEVLLVFDELPRTASLKVRKADLRDLALRRLA